MPFPWKDKFITSSSNNSSQEGGGSSGGSTSVGGHGTIISSVINARKIFSKSSSNKDVQEPGSVASSSTAVSVARTSCIPGACSVPVAKASVTKASAAVSIASGSTAVSSTSAAHRHPSGERIEDRPVEYAKLKSTIKTTCTSEHLSNALFKSKLIFHCQLAHGSPTGLISGFVDLHDLYRKMAECYDLSVDDILFCTLNSHKVDMNNLLGAQLALDDFIFIHIKGQKKEVEVEKTDSTLGVTITDNGIGKTFIKRIKPNTVFGRLTECIHPGDHIEKINDQSTLGKRHFEVAKLLRDMPIGEKFTLRLIEPLKTGFSNIAQKTYPNVVNNGVTAIASTNGVETIRFKSKGSKIVAANVWNEAVLERLNNILENFMGISDKDLALSILELGRNVENPKDFTDILRRSEFAEFEIPQDVAFDLWGAIKDHKDGRLPDEPTVSGYTSTKL